MSETIWVGGQDDGAGDGSFDSFDVDPVAAALSQSAGPGWDGGSGGDVYGPVDVAMDDLGVQAAAAIAWHDQLDAMEAEAQEQETYAAGEAEAASMLSAMAADRGVEIADMAVLLGELEREAAARGVSTPSEAAMVAYEVLGRYAPDNWPGAGNSPVASKFGAQRYVAHLASPGSHLERMRDRMEERNTWQRMRDERMRERGW